MDGFKVGNFVEQLAVVKSLTTPPHRIPLEVVAKITCKLACERANTRASAIVRTVSQCKRSHLLKRFFVE